MSRYPRCIISISHALAKSFLTFTSCDPVSVAQVLYNTMCGTTQDQVHRQSDTLQTPGDSCSSENDESMTHGPTSNTDGNPTDDSITPITRTRRLIDQTDSVQHAVLTSLWLS
jgi:hypothetical protein